MQINLYKDIIEAKKEISLSQIKKMPKTGVFDNFFVGFLLVFEKMLLKTLNKKRKYTINKEKVVQDALESLKKDLMGICSRTLILTIHNLKENGNLPGKDEHEQYENFDISLENIDLVKRIMDKYPVLNEKVTKRIETKIALIEDCLENLDNSIKKIESSFSIKIENLDGIVFGTGGDTHNNGKNVLILNINNSLKLVYKPHDLEADEQLKVFYDWINASGKTKYDLTLCRTISCKDFGWQEYVDHTPCKTKEEVEKYYYCIGEILALFYTIRTQDVHCENLIVNSGMPIVVDNESLLSNELNSIDRKGIAEEYCNLLKKSVYSSLIIPQNIQGSLFDIDLSPLGNSEQEKSQQLKGIRVINVGTSDIRMEEVYADIEHTHRYKHKVIFNNEIISAAMYLDQIILGFKQVYSLISERRDDFKKLLVAQNSKNVKYRQIVRPTYVYFKFLDASRHPKYLQNFSDMEKLFGILDNKGGIDKKIAEGEIKSLMNGDIPYFYTYQNSKNLFFKSGDSVSEIKNIFKHSINELILKKIDMMSDEDLNRQIDLIKVSFANANKGRKLVNDYLDCDTKKKITKETKERYILLAKKIGYRILEHVIYDRDEHSAAVIGLNINDRKEYVFGCSRGSLYDGMGIIIFLAMLYSETGEDCFKKASYALTKGMDELALPTTNISAFLGKTSQLYTYYFLVKIYQDDIFRKRYEEILINIIKDTNLENQYVDVIEGLSGAIIAFLNIYQKALDQRLLIFADNMGEMLIRKIDSFKAMTGMAHGYAGISYAFALLYKWTEKEKYKEFCVEIIKKENQWLNKNRDNWLDLRKEENQCQNFWCHGAPGIMLSRLKCMEVLPKEYESLLKDDIDIAIRRLNMSDSWCKGVDCLCHGVWGNIDTLLMACQHDLYSKAKLKEIIKDQINRILIEGFTFPNKMNEEIYNFMLGLSGIGYEMLRIYDNNIPSLLALEA